MAEKDIVLTVLGMSCQHCVNSIKNALGGLNGVGSVNVDLDSKKVSIEFDDEKISLDTIKDIIEDQGYEVKGD